MSFQAYIDNIKSKTGKTPEDFKKLAEKKGLLKPSVKAMEIVGWLKKDHGLGYVGVGDVPLAPLRNTALVEGHFGAATLQMSSTPELACLLALPSGSAILPSTTMGLFQCPEPVTRSAT